MRSLPIVAFLLFCAGSYAHADSILDGLSVNLAWVIGDGSTVYQSYNPATVGSGIEFNACPGPSYTCSGAGTAIGDVLGQPPTLNHVVPNNAVSVDISDTASTFTIFGADNADNTSFGVFAENGYEISIDESSALAHLGQNLYFTGASLTSSTGAWATSAPSVFQITPDGTGIMVNFQGLPSGPTSNCSGLKADQLCPSPTGTANTAVFSFTTKEVSPTTPEPASLLLFGSGLAALVSHVRKRRA